MDYHLLLAILACAFIIGYDPGKRPQNDDANDPSSPCVVDAAHVREAVLWSQKHTSAVTLERPVTCVLSTGVPIHTLGLMELIYHPVLWNGSRWVVPDLVSPPLYSVSSKTPVSFSDVKFPAICSVGPSMFLIHSLGCRFSFVCPRLPNLPFGQCYSVRL
nr:MAG: hypothetical protein [Wenzhou bat ribovirus 3]